MNTTRFTIKLQPGEQIRPGKLNDALKAAGFAFDGSHNAQEIIVACDPADEATIRAICTAHLATDHAAAEIVEAKRAEVQKRLDAIDSKSIRALREWVSKQADAPQFLKDRDAEAVAERAKLPR